MSVFRLARFLQRKLIGHYMILNVGPISCVSEDQADFLLVSEGQGYEVRIRKVELAT